LLLPEKTSINGICLLVLQQELRNLLVSPALWIMLIILSLLTGYSFFQAVELYSQASRTAVSFPQMAAAMNPLDGIFVPTFGAYYLSQTLLLPFVAIRLIGLDKQSGALKLLLQLPLSPLLLCCMKLLAMTLIWLFSLVPALFVLALWMFIGGHLYLPEILLLFAGHGLYAFTVIALGMFAATVSDALPTAAMFCLAFTLGLWVLDFSVAGQSGLSGLLSEISLTGLLRHFENGLLLSSSIVSFVAIGLLFFLASVVWLHPGRATSGNITRSAVLLLFVCLLAGTASVKPFHADVTENRKHSFNPADSHVLRQITDVFTLTIHLDSQDSRLRDLEKGLLAKLRRTVPGLRLQYVGSSGEAALFGASEDKQYGLFEYEYRGRRDQSYSSSEEEVFFIIYTLAGLHVDPESVAQYSGYPLVADAGGYWWIFYVILPLLFGCCGLYGRKGRM